MKIIEAIVAFIVGSHILMAAFMFIREWWLFRKAKKRTIKKVELPKPVVKPEQAKPSMAQLEVEEIRRILLKDTTRNVVNDEETDYEFDVNRLTKDEYNLLIEYARSRKKELDSYVDLCNKISDEPLADCSKDMKEVFGIIDISKLNKLVEYEANSANR